ncbi:F-box only protein 13 [Ananas comosus]|uniref:F-box only protein 13 n=1 Tax=Ananas comosus TaxID=4615 RepID=A0A199UN20_ANACO|nr:F-box only protein 13 [Ananas comosus]
MASPSSPHDPSSYHLVLVYGASPHLASRVFDSQTDAWGEEIPLSPHKPTGSSEPQVPGDEPVYFLSKTGDVVAANMQRSPCKQYSSVFATENGDDVVYFLSHSGTVVGCNLTKRSFFEHPRLLPAYYEYSIDIALFRGELCAIVLSEFLETASLRVWRFARETMTWHQAAAMPPSMSHEFFGKKVDINCVGFKDWIFTCLNSGDFSSCVVYDLGRDQWVEIPKCRVDGEAKEFVCAFPFEPRLEAVV